MSYHKNPNRRKHSYNDPVPKPLSQQTNYIINREFKPLYAFLLALATDVLMLENNQVDFNRAGGGVFLNVFGKSVGWRNIYFASSIALGVSVGENIGLWAIPPSPLIDENDHMARKKISLAMEIVLSIIFNAILTKYIFNWEKRPLNKPTNSGLMSIPEFEALIEIFTRNDNFNRGVNTETVLSNVVKTLFTTASINLSAESVSNLFEG